MKILITKDEQLAARGLARLLTELDKNVEVIQTIDSVEDAVNFLQSDEKTELIFMDIQLADGLSFDIFDQLKITTSVIFTAAYDQYALKAFKVNSVDYILKNIEEKDLKSALEKFRQLLRSNGKTMDYGPLIEAIRTGKETFKKRFLVKTASRLTFVLTDDIAYFFSNNGNIFLVTRQGDRFLIESALDEIEKQLNLSFFFRINRKMILSLECIVKIEPFVNNRFTLTTKPPFEEETIVSRQRSAEFKNWHDQ